MSHSSRPQFARRTHPALDVLRHYGRLLPGVWELLEARRLEAGSTPADAPCDDRLAGELYQLAAATTRAGGAHAAGAAAGMGQSPQWRALAALMAALGAWRYTQGIYRFDPTVYAAVVDTPLTGEIPAEVLARLPEWCVYIETPGHPDGALGAWVRLAPRDDGGATLCIYSVPADAALTPEPVHMPLGAGVTLDGQVQAYVDSIPDALPGERERLVAHVAPIINLALYLCSVGGDITGRHGQPGNPRPTRTRRDGWRLFPADGPRHWEAGVRMGAALRAAYAAEQAGQAAPHAGPRPHIRRAHWHGFWSGPRAGERRYDLRWLPPIAVKLDDLAQLPATVRPVRGGGGQGAPGGG